MPLLSEATAIHVGDTPATKVYLGGTKVWPPIPPPVGPAVLAGQDGDWRSRGWGTSGYVFADGLVESKQPPPEFTFSCTGAEYAWNPNTQHTSGFIRPSGVDRIQCCYYGTPMDASLTFTQDWIGTVRFYFLSMANEDRSQSVTPFHNGVAVGPTLNLWGDNPATWFGSGQVSAPMLPGGRWLAYDLNMKAGDVFKIGMFLLGGVNVVMAGAVFDSAVPPVHPPYDPATMAYMTATGLAPAYTSVVDNLVKGLKQYGLWSKMKAVYPFIGGTVDLHKWNLIDPRDSDAAYRLTFTGGSHSAAEGYRPNLSGNSFGNMANSHLVPLGTLTQDSTHMAMYSLLNVAPDDRCEMGMFNWGGGTERFNLIAQYFGNAYYYGMSDASTPATAPVTVSSGLFVSTRTGATVQAAYRNGAVVGTSSNPSIPLPPVPVSVGGLTGYAQGPSNLPFGFASIGAGLTVQENADLYTVVQDYQTALGRQRSPLE